MTASVHVVAEGDSDATMAQRLLGLVGLEAWAIHVTGGKSKLDARLANYNASANAVPWLVIRDLDRDAPCPGELAARLVPRPGRLLCLRICVRAGESWLLGDRERIAESLQVTLASVTTALESLDSPKAEMLRLAGRSRSRLVRMDLQPRAGSSAKVGPGYSGRMTEFAGDRWRPEVAARACPSLERALASLHRFARLLTQSR